MSNKEMPRLIFLHKFEGDGVIAWSEDLIDHADVPYVRMDISNKVYKAAVQMYEEKYGKKP